MSLTTIAITRELKKELDKLKKYKESYLDVVARLIYNNKK